MEVVSAAILLFLIMDPLGNIPVFLSLLKGLPPARQRVVLARELVIALGVLLVFGLTESRVLGFTGLSRTLVAYIQLTMAILPIFVLITTVRSVAGDREASHRMLHSAHSLLALGHVQDAATALRLVLQQCQGRADRALLARRAQGLLQVLQARLPTPAQP